MMKPLIDADVLRYEVGSIGENEEEGIKSFDFVAGVLDGRIRDICEAVQATEEPTLYLTGPGNFREAVAFTKPYKGNRKDEKPYHFDNITAYMYNQYDVVLAEGLEADDMMAIDQVTASKEGRWTIICTRDKDLRMVPGDHYGWECGRQHEYGPKTVHPRGNLEWDETKKKLTGTGMLFFWAQMLMGDSTDNIPGCPGIGPKKAWQILSKDNGLTEWEKVRNTYHSKGLKDNVILEQGQLLWIVQELDEDGKPVIWQLPD